VLANQLGKVSVWVEVVSSTSAPKSTPRPMRVSTPAMASRQSSGTSRSVSPSGGSGLIERRELGAEAGALEAGEGVEGGGGGGTAAAAAASGEGEQEGVGKEDRGWSGLAGRECARWVRRS